MSHIILEDYQQGKVFPPTFYVILRKLLDHIELLIELTMISLRCSAMRYQRGKILPVVTSIVVKMQKQHHIKYFPDFLQIFLRISDIVLQIFPKNFARMSRPARILRETSCAANISDQQETARF